MITRPGYVTANGTPPARAVRAVIEEHMEGLSRLNRLRAYYDGRHPICARQRKSGLPNARLVNGFPHYITTMAAGYLIGSPVTYAAEGRQRLALESVLRDLRAANIDSVDAELARDASIFGKGVELIYADEQARARTAALDPRSAFVVYDDTVACKPLFGVCSPAPATNVEETAACAWTCIPPRARRATSVATLCAWRRAIWCIRGRTTSAACPWWSTGTARTSAEILRAF